MKKRIYKGSDIGMLMTIRTIIKNFIKKADELSVIQSNYTMEYGNELQSMCDKTMDAVLGKDYGQKHIDATNALNEMMESAQRELSMLKLQIEVNFRKEPELRDKMLRMLKLKNNFEKLRKGNQEALVETLIAFNDNLQDFNPALKAKSINTETGVKVAGYLNIVREAESLQEELKTSKPELTEQNVVMMNDIYEEVISICKIAQRFYQTDETVKKQFSYTHVYRTMLHPWKSEKEATIEEV